MGTQGAKPWRASHDLLLDPQLEHLGLAWRKTPSPGINSRRNVVEKQKTSFITIIKFSLEKPLWLFKFQPLFFVINDIQIFFDRQLLLELNGALPRNSLIVDVLKPGTSDWLPSRKSKQRKHNYC